MRRYIAFLRGINVGGHKIIKMVDLAKIFASMEFTNVRTFIQSGNVFFCSDETDESVLLALIETTLSKKMGYDVQVMIRRIDYLEKMIAKKPFGKVSPTETLKCYVAFLSGTPDKKLADALVAMSNDIETFIIKGQEVFIMVDKAQPKPSRYIMDTFEKKIGVKATTRNWETLGRMMESKAL